MKWIIGLVCVAFWLNWWPFDETDRAIESSEFNVFFYYPSGQERYLGISDGVDGCRFLSRGFASTSGMPESKWNYVCCRIKSDSQCYSKHK